MAGVSTLSRMAVGVAAAAAGVGVSQLLSAFFSPAADATNLVPRSVREWALQEFGTSARLFLSLMVLEVIVAVVAVTAIGGNSRRLLGSFLAVGAISCAAVVARPEARLFDIVPTLAGVASAVAVLRLLTSDRMADRMADRTSDPTAQIDAIDAGRRRSLLTIGFATAGLASGVAGAISTRPATNRGTPAAPHPWVPPSSVGTQPTTVGRIRITAPDALELKNAMGFGKTVFVENFRDGVLTDNQIISAAFDALEAGGEIRFGQGVTYVLDGYLDFYMTDKPNVLISGQGATLDGTSGVYVLLRIQGSKYTGGVTTLTAAIEKRTKTLTIASSAGYAPGDLVGISSDSELFNRDGGLVNFKQELARIAAVPNDTSIVLNERTWNTYSLTDHTVTLQQYRPVKNLIIRDLSFVGVRSTKQDDASADQYGLWVRYFDGVTVENVKVNGTTSVGIVGQEGINFTVSECRTENILKTNGGVSLYALDCHVAKFLDCYVRDGRHAIDIDRVRDALYSGCTAEGTGAAAFSTHGNCDVAKIVDCTARECGGGIIVRGKNTIVRGNHVLGSKLPAEQTVAHSYVHGIRVGHYSPAAYGDGNGGIDLVIEGNFVDISGPDYSTRDDLLASGIFVSAGLVNSRINNNTIRGFPWHGICCVGDYNKGAEISGNLIDCSSQLAGEVRSGIKLSPDHSGGIQSHLTIERNRIDQGSVHSGIYIAGGASRDSASNHIRIRNNQVGTCGSAPIYLGNGGHFGSDIVIYGNQTDSVMAVSFGSSTFVTKPYIGMHGYGQGPRPLGIGQEAGARMRPGLYYGPTGTTGTSIRATLNCLSAVPLFVPQRVNIDSIGVTLATESGAGGSQARLAIYEDVKDGYGGYPGNLILESIGTVSTDSTGYREDKTLWVTLDPGLYWLVFVAQTASPGVFVVSGSNPMVGSASAITSDKCGYVQNDVSGELPSSFTTRVKSRGDLPIVQIHIAS